MENEEHKFSEALADPDPLKQFDNWYKEHLTCGISVPESMSLGTSSKNGTVSVRTVLLKDYDNNGFVFFTNYNSRKGKDLNFNPFAAILFYWPESARQVRIEGVVSMITSKESDAYFNSRPEESKLSAWASDQSSVITGREFLENRFEFYKNAFRNKLIERPSHWGGYRLTPSWFEFWQEGKFRLHDRVTYSLSGDKWTIATLAP